MLIADDSVSERRRLLDACARLGHEADAVHGGFEALKRLKTNNFDILVCDISMPDMTGIDVLRMTRSVCPHVAVLMCTSCDTLDSTVAAMRLGAVDYLVKPWQDEDLAAALRRGATVAAALQRKSRMVVALKEQVRLREEEHTKRVTEAEQLARELQGLQSLFQDGASEGLSVVVNLLRRVDPSLTEHARRVAEICVRVATRLQVRPEDVSGLEIAARLHDVGLVAEEALVAKIHRGDASLSSAEDDALAEASRSTAKALAGMPAVGHAASILQHFRQHDETRVGSRVPLSASILIAVERFDVAAYMVEGAPGKAAGLFQLKRHEQSQTARSIRLALHEVLGEFDPQAPAPQPHSADSPSAGAVLQVGQRLTEPMRTPAGLVLLPAGTVLTHALIQKVEKILSTR